MRGSDLLIVGGIVLVLIGVAARFGLLGWFGNLPGDIRVEGDRSSVFVPITSMVVVSVVGSLLVNVIARLFRS